MNNETGIEFRGARHRVLMLAPHPDISGSVPGPIAKVAYRLADALRASGHEVDTELWGRHQREEGLVQKVAGRAGDLIRIRRAIGEGAYDLVLVHTTHDSRAVLRDLLLIMPSPADTRWVLLVHGSHFSPGRPIFDAAVRTLVGRASAVLLLSTDEMAEWERFFPRGHYHLVANALPVSPPGSATSRTASSEPGRSEVLYVGRLIREKGLFELLDAFATLRSRRVCHLTIAGEGPESGALLRRAASLGIEQDVTFTGHLLESDVHGLYRAADVLVLPSYSEGLPTVLLEAMSEGLPIVTTRIRGAADHLVEGENALFVPPRDADALAAALERLLGDDSLRAAMRENNLRKARDFSPERVARAYVRVFDEVVGRKDAR